jgi:hypothetical protein
MKEEAIVARWGCKISKAQSGLGTLIHSDTFPYIEVVDVRKFLSLIPKDVLLKSINGGSFGLVSTSIGRQAIRDGLTYDEAVTKLVTSLSKKFWLPL